KSSSLLVSRGRDVVRPGSLVAAARAVALGGDEPVEPAHLALDLLQPVPLQLERVLVEPFAGAGCGLPDRLQPFGQPGAPAFEDAEAGLGVRLREQREPDVEALVLPGRRAGGGKSGLEVLLAVGSEPVHDTPAASGQRLGAR